MTFPATKKNNYRYSRISVWKAILLYKENAFLNTRYDYLLHRFLKISTEVSNFILIISMHMYNVCAWNKMEKQ